MKTSFLLCPVAICMAFPYFAAAQCGAPASSRQFLYRGNVRPLPSVLETAEAARLDSPAAVDPSVVGLWDVLFTSGGQPYDEGFDQYQSDGTEIMNDITPPVAGNICLGVWAKTGSRSYKLRHPFWIFDFNGNLIGRGVLTENFTLNASGDGYSGTFTFAFRDLNGNPIPDMPDVSGSLSATRITPDQP